MRSRRSRSSRRSKQMRPLKKTMKSISSFFKKAVRAGKKIVRRVTCRRR